jgi:hypothetical protein
MVVKINGKPIPVTEQPKVTLTRKDMIAPVGTGILGLVFIEVATQKMFHGSAIHMMFSGLDTMVFHGLKVMLECISLLLP